ncbi:MAG: integrase family protein [Desulfobacterales bacterium]|nr:integrase family protein [Desulfobacterales bacterium]
MPKSTKVNFTNGRINEFSCPAGTKASFYWDAGVPGLGVRATAGSRSYIFQGSLPGDNNKFRITLGATGALTLEAARDMARDLAAKVAQGIDPRQEKKEQAAAAEAAKAQETQNAVTLAEAWPVYLEARKGKWSQRHYEDHVKLIDPGGRKAKSKGKGKTIKPGALAALRPMKLSDINDAAVRTWLTKEVTTRATQAGLAFRLLKAFLNWCSDHPDYKDAVDTGACGRRVRKDVLPSAKPKDDCLQKEQLKTWFAGVRKLDNRVASAYLQALLLTGARRSELASLLWENVDFQWRSITIHDKVEGERTIPLPPYLAALIYPLPRSFKTKDGVVKSPFVFASPTAAAGFLQDPRRLHTRACKAAGIKGLTLHGLRRSFGTLSEWVECPVGVVAQIQGHKPSAIAEKHYRRRPLDLLRLWHVKIEGWILEQSGIQQPAEDAELGKLRAVK